MADPQPTADEVRARLAALQARLESTRAADDHLVLAAPEEPADTDATQSGTLVRLMSLEARLRAMGGAP